MSLKSASLIVVSLSVLLIPACTGSNPAAPPPPFVFKLVPPTPPLAFCDLTTNDPGQPIAGCWVGTFATSDPADCGGPGAATATFEQSGASVHGTISAQDSCGLEDATFEGALEDGTLSGTLTIGQRRGTAKGILSDVQLELSTTDLSLGNTVVPGGHLHLHR